ncbi:HesB/YadR/YfhF family protein [Lysinibacillus sp. 54212]|uniref:HesB/YadR/YfhF family protein n=1 Tax=Lysinibacillus sp. 54212 TaxID=3119829 RepID=UPI002FC87DBC
MNIIVTNEALHWFKDEMEVKQGDHIRFYARYGGSSPFHEGFSIGMNREMPHEMGVEAVIEGIHFYIEKADEWFFNEHDLYVTVNKRLDELTYEYKRAV